jgi:hypothetical protein
LVLALIAWTEKHYRTLSSDGTPALSQAEREIKHDSKTYQAPQANQSYGPLVMGFGNLIFLIQTIITDAGTVIAWSWTGYPVNGPELLRHAFIPITSATLGFLLAARLQDHVFASKLWSAFGCLSSFLFVRYQDWLGFIGGCGLIIFATSLLPLFFRQLSAVNQRDFGAVFGKAMLVNALWDVVSVLTVAYAFVPGGQLFRERMDLVMYFSVAMVCWNLHRVEGGKSLARFTNTRRSPGIQWLLVLGAIASFILCVHLRRKLPHVVPYHSHESRVWTGGIWAVSGRHSHPFHKCHTHSLICSLIRFTLALTKMATTVSAE